MLDAANPPPMPEPRRRQLAIALMLLAVEIQSEILAAARDEDAAAFDVEGRNRIAALGAWVTQARSRGRIAAAPARALLDALAMQD